MSQTVRSGFTYTFWLTMFLTLVWLCWSGQYGSLLLSFGVVSVLLTVWVSKTLNVVDDEGQPISWRAGPLWYFPWLLKEVVIANLDVIKRILSPSLNISPTWVRLPAKQSSRLGRVVFANSITLTPGTVSVELGDDFILVHALSSEGAESLIDGGVMGETVCKLEGVS